MPKGIYIRLKNKSYGMQGKHHSEKSKRKMSEAHKGFFHPNTGFQKGHPKPKNAYSFKIGHRPTKETRKKLSEAAKGRRLTKETKQKISIAHKGKPAWNKGKKLGFIPKGAFKKGHQMNRGAENPAWKGGRTKVGGYVLVRKPGHPFAHKGASYVCEHRLVVEKIIGRYLQPYEEVHHLGEKDDNRPHMLMAFANEGAHKKFECGKPVKPEEIIFDGRLLVKQMKGGRSQ